MADASKALSTANSAKAAVANAGLAGRNYALKTSVPVTYTSTDDTKQITYYYYQGVLGNAASLQGATVTVSFDYEVELVQGSFILMVDQVWYGLKEFNNSNGDGTVANTINESGHFSKTFTLHQTLTRIQSTAGNSGLPLGYVYIQGNFEGSCRLSNFKWELGSTETAWQPAPEDSQYLFQTLTEARGDKTDIQGGLVLSSFLGVRNSSGTIVAGLQGTDAAVQNQLPMIWAGASANTDSGITTSKFKVYNGGHVDMSDVNISSTGAGKATINNGVLSVMNGTYKTVVSSERMSSMQTAINSSASKNTYSVSESRIFLLQERRETSNLKPLDINYSGSNVLFTSTPAKEATLAIPAFSVTFLVSIDSQYSGGKDKRNRSWARAVISIRLIVGSNIYVLNQWKPDIVCTDVQNHGYNAAISREETISVDAQNLIIPKGKTCKLELAWSYKGTLCPDETNIYTQDGDDEWKYTSDVYAELELRATPTAFTATVTQGEYRNSYYADGMFLQSASTKYFGVSTWDSSTLFQMRFGTPMLKFDTSGLLQSLNGGSSFHRVNPFVGVLTIVFNSAKNYTGRWRTWWYTKTTVPSVSITCNTAGQLRIKHSIGRDDTLWYVTHYNIGTYKYGRTFSFKDDPQDSNNYTWLYINSGNSNYDLQNAGDQIYILCMVLNTWIKQ